MKSADIRYRSDTPATPEANLLTLFVNSSGAPLVIMPDASVKPLNARFFETATGVPVQACVNPTGAFGMTGRWMGGPDNFLAITGPTGQLWAIPVYLRS